MAPARVERPETRPSWAVSQACKASTIGLLRSCRAARRSSAGRPRTSASIA